MKEKELKIDGTRHAIYSRKCKKEIKKKIALHYPREEVEQVWEAIQLQYVDFLNRWEVNLGGKKNFHNGTGGTYDCLAILTYYFVCKDVTSPREIEEIEENLILPSFRKLWFVDCNKPFFKKLMYKSFSVAKSKCDKWDDYKMNVSPFEKDKPIYYEFTFCPVASFAREFGLTEAMPYLCNVDYKSMELIKARLIRKGTCVDRDRCDYCICGSNDNYISKHPEYVDEKGFRRNK